MCAASSSRTKAGSSPRHGNAMSSARKR
jgi:hypothetical protein